MSRQIPRHTPRTARRERAVVGTILLISLLLGGIWLLSACSPADGDPSLTPANVTAASSVEPTLTLTPSPTATETPLPPRALLVLPQDVDPVVAEALDQTIAQLASASGLSLERVPDLSSSDLTDHTRIVVALPTSADLGALANANPGIAFIGVGIPGLEAGANLSAVGPEGFRPDQQGFVAGYLAAMQTDDWRVAVLSDGDTLEGQAARQGFLNGAIFFCGLCRPAFPPFVLYPTFVDLPSQADAAAHQAAVQALLGEAVTTVYVYPGVDDQTLQDALTTAGFNLITGTGDANTVPTNVIGQVLPAPAPGVEMLWTELLGGSEGRIIPMPISVRTVNPDRISEGRITRLNGLIQDLYNQVVDTGIDPLTGEIR